MNMDFCGKNQVPLLQACSNFGTRAGAGKDASSPRYTDTKLSVITPKLFRVEDMPFLEQKTDDGVPIEPACLCPILPMILINGSEGLAR